MKKLLLTASAAAALAFSATPAAAQDDTGTEMAEAELADAMAGLAELYPVEPLTAEQQSRLPIARRIVSQFMPDGAMVEMMDSMFGGIMAPMTEAEIDAGSALESALGYMVSASEMDEADILATLAIVDPQWETRNAAQAEAVAQMMTRMAEVMEPMMWDVTSELYAIYFTQAQLEDIEVFFQTDSGAAFARSSWRMASDPRIMGRMFSNEAMWGEMFSLEDMEAQMEALPTSRSYEDLSPEERARVLELTGLTDDALRAGISTDWEYADEAAEAMEEVEENVVEKAPE